MRRRQALASIGAVALLLLASPVIAQSDSPCSVGIVDMKGFTPDWRAAPGTPAVGTNLLFHCRNCLPTAMLRLHTAPAQSGPMPLGIEVLEDADDATRLKIAEQWLLRIGPCNAWQTQPIGPRTIGGQRFSGIAYMAQCPGSPFILHHTYFAATGECQRAVDLNFIRQPTPDANDAAAFERALDHVPFGPGAAGPPTFSTVRPAQTQPAIPPPPPPDDKARRAALSRTLPKAPPMDRCGVTMDAERLGSEWEPQRQPDFPGDLAFGQYAGVRCPNCSPLLIVTALARNYPEAEEVSEKRQARIAHSNVSIANAWAADRLVTLEKRRPNCLLGGARYTGDRTIAGVKFLGMSFDTHCEAPPPNVTRAIVYQGVSRGCQFEIRLSWPGDDPLSESNGAIVDRAIGTLEWSYGK